MKWKTGIVCLMIISLFAFHAWCDEPRDISEIDQKMDFDIENVNVKLLLNKIFSEVSKLDFVFDECVQGRVSIKLHNVPLCDAFRLILKNAGLDYEQEGNLVRIYCNADSNTANTDSNESTALPSIRAKVFASIKEKDEEEREVLSPWMEREFTEGLFIILPHKGEQPYQPVFVKTVIKDGRLLPRAQPPLEIKFSLNNLLPEGVEVKVSFSYYKELEYDEDGQLCNTISGSRQKILTPSNADEPIFLFKAPDGDEYYLSVIPEEWPQ